MAFNSFKSYLMKGSGTGTITYSKLVDIKSFPDLGDTPEFIDATTLSDPQEWGVAGIVKSGNALEFTCNYDEEAYETINALSETDTPFAIWLGASQSAGVYTPDGSNGKFEFTGYAFAIKSGAGVNEVQEMKVSIIPSSPVKKVARG